MTDDPGQSRRPTPQLDRIARRLATASPVFRDVVGRQRRDLGEDWAAAFDEMVGRMLRDDDDLALTVDGYVRFAIEILRLQARFDHTGEYEPKTYAAVTADIYANDTYMRTCYLPGLMLSHYLWPHHYRQAEFFERVFVDEMRRARATAFHDVGVGTGFFSRLALVALPGLVGRGFDISPLSRDYAIRHAEAYGVGDRYGVELRDIVRDPPDSIDWLVCVEVLEHLEDPVEFIRALRGVVRQGGRAFIATALNAPNADHIYLYRTADDVISQLRDGGFSVEQYFCALAGTLARSDVPVPEVAAFIVT